MPIDINSEEWKSANKLDAIRTEINNLIRKDYDKAYSITEIEEHLIENHPEVFPLKLRQEGESSGSSAARQAVIIRLVEDRYWHSHWEFRQIEGELFVTATKGGFSPIAELDEIRVHGSESSRMSDALKGRFEAVEKNREEEISELEERIDHLQHQLQQLRRETGTF